MFLFLKFLFIAVFAAATAESGDILSQGQQTKPFDVYMPRFLGLIHTAVPRMINVLEVDFSGQIRESLRDNAALHQLIEKLPFEPDNLGTDDCTFNACCSVLLLHEFLRTDSSGESPPSQENLKLLTQIAVLTYFMHSSDFFEFISRIGNSVYEVLQRYEQQLQKQDFSVTARQVFSSSECSHFSDYKKDTLTKMCIFMSEKLTNYKIISEYNNAKLTIVYRLKSETQAAEDQQKDEVSSTSTGPAAAAQITTDKKVKGQRQARLTEKVTPHGRSNDSDTGASLSNQVKKTTKEELTRITKDAQQELLQCVQRHTTKSHIILEREFQHGKLTTENGQIDEKVKIWSADSDGDTLLAEGIVVINLEGKKEYRVDPVASSSSSSPAETSNTFYPRVVLQIPTVKYASKTVQYLADTSERIAHSTQTGEERAEKHAVTANLLTVLSKPTWFRDPRGLKPKDTAYQHQIQELIKQVFRSESEARRFESQLKMESGGVASC